VVIARFSNELGIQLLGR